MKNSIFTGIPNPNSRCHFNTFHRICGEYRICPDPICDYPMIPVESTIKRQTIDIRRMSGRSEESVRKRGQKLSKKYKFKIIDEFVSQNLHIILTDLTDEQIKLIQDDSMVYHVEDIPKITLNSGRSYNVQP